MLERIKHPDSKARLDFGRTWMQSHIDDSDKVLGMPVVFGEFGVSRKHEGFSFAFRDTFINMVHQTLLRSTNRGGSGAGSLLWQLFTEGTENMDDGYAVILPKAPSVSHMLALQSKRLKSLVTERSRKSLWSGKIKTC